MDGRAIEIIAQNKYPLISPVAVVGYGASEGEIDMHVLLWDVFTQTETTARKVAVGGSGRERCLQAVKDS